MSNRLLDDAQRERFHRDGLLIIPGFYQVERDILPIHRAIHGIIGSILTRQGMADARPAFTSQTFDASYQQLIASDRRLGGEVYDAVKQIPAFNRLVCDERNERLVCELRGTDMAGLAAGGHGIRIDNPSEDRFKADWHQEYPAQLRSLDGVVFWSPLVPMTEEIGPVRFCLGSHRDGLVRVHTKDPANPAKTGAYGLMLENRDQRVAAYRQIAPLLQPGDLIVVDFLTLHASGTNRSTRSRWSMQFRYFNFHDPTGIRIGWRGSYAAGVDFATIHPELIAE